MDNQYYNNSIGTYSDPSAAAGAALGNLIYSWIASFGDIQ